MGIKKIMLIINPCAGRKSGKKNSDKVVELFRQNGAECILFMTEKKRGRHRLCHQRRREV